MNALICLATLFLASSAGQAGDPPESSPWLIYSELMREDTAFSIRAARPGQRLELGTLEVLPGIEPYARLSDDGRALFIARHRQLNHAERSATLYRFDIDTRRLTHISDTADASPPLPLGPRAVAWIETHQIHEVDEERLAAGELFGVEQSVQADLDGERVELARFDHIYGAHFAGLTEQGIVLYVVSRQEAAFYLLPLSGPQIDRAAGPIRRALNRRPSVKAAIESRDESHPPSGILRLARAPAGPFARDFAVSGSTLFFGSLTDDRTTKALYALDLAVDDLDRASDKTAGDSGRESDLESARKATQLEATGERHPEPVAHKDSVFFTRAEGSDRERRLVSRVDLKGTVPLPAMADAMRQARQTWASTDRAARREAEATLAPTSETLLRRRELLRVRGQARVLAALPDQNILALQRRAANDSEPLKGGHAVELLWVDTARHTSERVSTVDIHRAFGFAEVTP